MMTSSIMPVLLDLVICNRLLVRFMQRVALYCIIILLLCILCQVQGSSCQQYNVSTNAFCLALTPYPVFLSNSATQDDLAQNIFRVLNVSSENFGRDVVASLRQSPLPPPCIAAIRSLLCSVYIPGLSSDFSCIDARLTNGRM
jgi:hypothetical protein